MGPSMVGTQPGWTRDPLRFCWVRMDGRGQQGERLPDEAVARRRGVPLDAILAKTRGVRLRRKVI